MNKGVRLIFYYKVLINLFFILVLTTKVIANYEEDLLTQLIMAEPGDIIEIPEGTYDISLQLSLTVSDVTLRGKGKDKSILSFKKQSSGAEGLYVSAHNITLEDFSILDTKGDAIKVVDSQNIIFRNLKVGWTGEISEENGGYGFYPVKSENILIEACEAFGASDAGIYVGQSKNIIVRNNHIHHNVSGIEIENSFHADVYGNKAEHNAGGILVFNLPGLSVYGSHTRVYRNEIHNNNTRNFSSLGNIVASVPQGTGIMVMANNYVEIFENNVSNNDTTNLLLVSYYSLKKSVDKPSYDPYSRFVYIYNNTFINGGHNPKGGATERSKQQIKKIKRVLGLNFPDIIYDAYGTINEGQHTNIHKVCVNNRLESGFVSLDAEHDFESLSKDITFYKCDLDKLDPVTLPF